MKIRQGEVYLANFGTKYNSELGKIRPAVVVQNNFFNRALKSKDYKQILLVPLSTKPIIDDYRIPIKARDNLQKDSFIIANWICTIDFEHLLVEKGVLTKLSEDEFNELKKRVCDLM